jgi:hypothetical protein
MRNRTFRTLARWSLALAACAGPACNASSIITNPAPADAPISMLELEQALFGLDQADSYSIAGADQLWTSDANAALYTNMLALITTLGGDQALIAQLFEPGAVFAGQTNPLTVANSQAVVNFQEFSAPSGVPEPATMGLLGGTLLFLCCYAFFLAGSVRGAKRQPPTEAHGPIQSTD